MSPPALVLDACALIPIRLATTLLWLAEARLFQPLWSEIILDEVQRNLPRVGVSPEQASRRVALMRKSFGSEALVGDFEELIEQMNCDPKDRHVLAAAVHAGAVGILTFNVRDFPRQAVEPHGIEVHQPDIFLTRLLLDHPEAVLSTLDAAVGNFRNPPTSLTDFFLALRPTVPRFSALGIATTTPDP